ncbi:HoxA-like transcriptional regulator [Salinadaptatus halalkaliphilus]|uniref:HoxA-like transcriptional regulator n=1 Tax=Salinadaptatus halalkaliphilus TaxID=2419781 RepID=A0A4S3TJ94_9EURY|nr:helix-turn-helix domain-containing protein [Salinadaptatus halalkaliphilus]THE64149.1 HoxA-like transcriptional regulator [Salinadaptatus halalkaliphilus]
MTDSETDVPATARTALEALSLLSNKWHPVIVVTLSHHGPLGFNELLEAIPDVSSKVLTDALEALSDAGLVERSVESESPLRVNYELTAAGADMQPVFDALGEWGTRHLETATPTVLLVDRDRRITEMYSDWLAGRYAVRRAHSADAFDAKLDDAVDVVVLDDGFPGATPSDVTSSVGSCRTVLLVDSRPDLDLLESDCDDVHRKPIVRETALQTIDEQLKRQGESPAVREQRAIAAKLSLLETVANRTRLEESDAYAELRSKLDDAATPLEDT